MKKQIMTIMAAALVSVFCAVPAFAGELTSGNYSLKQGSKSVNVYVDDMDSAKNYTPINMYQSDTSDTQDFIFEKQENGSYKIMVSKDGYTMNVKSLKVNTDVIVYKDKKANTEYYIVEPAETEGYYTVRLENNDSLALTAVKGNGLTFKKFTGESSQQFYFEANEASEQSKGQEDQIQLNVPRISTQDKRWADFEYDKNAKIKTYGCLLVACTAALSEYDGETYRPDQLASKFDFQDGYMQWDSGWGKRFDPDVKFSYDTIVKELEKGNAVLVHGYSSRYGNHWAVITGASGAKKEAKDFMVMDGSFQSVETLEDFFDKGFSQKKRLATIKK